MYKKVETDMNFVEREKETAKFWKDNDIFQKSIKQREGDPTYMFFDGPPTANGKPHIGHVLTRVIKDMIPRYRTMKGYHVLRGSSYPCEICDSHTGIFYPISDEDNKPQYHAHCCCLVVYSYVDRI